jgi:hypothetical protein
MQEPHTHLHCNLEPGGGARVGLAFKKLVALRYESRNWTAIFSVEE